MIRKAIESDSEKNVKLIVESWKAAYRGLIADDYLDNMLLKTIEKNIGKNIE